MGTWINDIFNGVMNAFSKTHVKLVAQGGTQIIDTTGTFIGLEGKSIMAQTDAVILVCTGINGQIPSAIIDFKVTYNWVTIKAGIPIIAPDGCKITNITLISGSIAVYS